MKFSEYLNNESINESSKTFSLHSWVSVENAMKKHTS